MRRILCSLVILGAALGSAPAHAVNGCRVLLCLAGNWKNISQCRPEVEQAIHDVERGRGWPSCEQSGVENVANSQWLTEATCPAMYSTYNPDTGAWASCAYSGIISVKVRNAPWTDVFWSSDGRTSTRYYAPARAALGDAVDPTYDRDAAAYVPPAPPVPCVGGDSC